MTKEIDNKVKEYLERATEIAFNREVDKEYPIHNITSIAELIQREEHYQKSNKVNPNRRDDLTPGQVQEVKDIIDSRHITRHRESEGCHEIRPYSKKELSDLAAKIDKEESPQSINTLKVGDRVRFIGDPEQEYLGDFRPGYNYLPDIKTGMAGKVKDIGSSKGTEDTTVIVTFEALGFETHVRREDLKLI